MQSAATDFIASGGLPLSIIILCSCIICLLCTGSLLECFPSLLAAMVKWKESENINYSAKLSRCRTYCCVALTPAFLLICSGYRLFAPSEGLPAMGALGVTAAAFAGWLLIRILLERIFRNRTMRQDAWKSAVNSPESFFCILTLLMAASCGIFNLCGCSDTTAATVLLWEIGVLYLMCIIKKTQIFVHYRGIFWGILYLCTLEIIPSGLLIAANLIF